MALLLGGASLASAEEDDPKVAREGWPGDATDDEPEADDAPAADEAAGPGFRLPDLSILTGEPVRGIASSGFGWRDDPIRHRRRFHRGGDYRAARGTPVYAAAGGEVVFSGRRGGYGRSIDILHGDGVLTRYAHLSKLLVKRGERVTVDQRIGDVGATGRATGAHLHFEVRIDGRAVDPTLAVRIGRLQRTAPADVVNAAAVDLAPEAQERSVSTLDPPRPHHAKRRRPNS